MNSTVHRRTHTGSESEEISLLIGDYSSDLNQLSDDKKKYSKKWNFTEYTKNLQSGLSGIGSNILNNINPNYQQLVQTDNQQQNSNSLHQQNNKFDQQKQQSDTFFDDLLLNFSSTTEELMTTSRDRTVEFSNAIRSLQGRNISRAANIRDPKKARQLQSYAEFMMIAKHIGKNIANTYSKLEKLALLAKRKSLFDDRPAEIQELTYIVKGDLNSLNQQIARLLEISKSQKKTTNGKHLVSHSSNMVVALQSKLANMSTDFKQILEVRTENLKHQKTRRDQFSQGPVSNSLPPSAMRGSTQGSLLLSEQEQVSIDISQSQSLMPRQQLQQQQQQQMIMYDESDNYVHQRAETMQNIESTIVELGGIFQQLAHMVKEQEEMVDRIDTNIGDTEMNVEAAHTEILKYFQSVTKNRWLMIKIFSVLLFFFIFFVIFLA